MNTQLKVDLHCHSTFSDGSFSPEDVVNKAHDTGVEVLALTDHDTINGITKARHTAKSLNMRLLNGVEISCEHTLQGGYGKHKNCIKIIHIVGLGFNNTELMHQKLSQLQQSRADRGRKMVNNLSNILSLDADAFWQSVLTKVDGNPQAVGRTHIAQHLFEIGVVDKVQQAFDKYLADNKAAYVKIDALTMQDGINLIHQCGGKAVLAHPSRYRLSATRIRKLIAAFSSMGGDACELPMPNEPLSQRHMIDRAIEQHELMVSIGSDFHGPSMPWRRLGQVPKPHKSQQGVWNDLL